MNKKLIPALSFGLAVLLIGSIAYASDRRRNAKAQDLLDNNIHEEEILRSELLEAVEPTEPLEIKLTNRDNIRTVAAINLDELKDDVLPGKTAK